MPVQNVRQTYWNEYDDGSDAENEPYTIFVNPDTESFPGAKTFAYVFARAKKPVESIKTWFSPCTSPNETRPLLANENGGYFNEQQSVVDTDIDDEVYASSTEFPAGYATHYATFPSVQDQKFSKHREQLLLHVMLGCFGAALGFLAIASTLVATGKRKLRVEVDVGVLVGVLASLFFAALGIGSMLYRKERLSWLYRSCVCVTFFTICILNSMLLVLVVGNTGL
jgi:hypothetical protein